MDFEETLRRWDKLQKEEASGKKHEKGPGKKANASKAQEASRSQKALAVPPKDDVQHSLERWIASHGVSDKDAEHEGADDGDRSEKIKEAQRLRKLKPQASLDLHGRTAIEAQALLSEFLGSSSRSGLDKVLVIHGKGLHSNSEPIMSDLVRSVLEESDLAGSFGPAAKEYGGRGATWVLIREKVHFSR
ncbi:MAG: Smr/MutS family protein [Spirochaetes bacterium]|nr:Smr/MutS family protein [Spirochaetota bacterium]